MSPEQREAARKIAELLRPFVQPAEFEGDAWHTHDVVRDIAREALQLAGTYGMHGCRLCGG